MPDTPISTHSNPFSASWNSNPTERENRPYPFPAYSTLPISANPILQPSANHLKIYCFRAHPAPDNLILAPIYGTPILSIHTDPKSITIYPYNPMVTFATISWPTSTSQPSPPHLTGRQYSSNGRMVTTL